MQNELDFNQLSLYLMRNVMVTFADGECVSGMLMEIAADTNEIRLDDTRYPICNLSDMEMTGRITYHIYADDQKKTCDIDNLYFGMDDFVPDTDIRKILYGEFACNGACHLVFDKKITAKDIRILSHAHHLSMPVLSDAPHIYQMSDGSVLVGVLKSDGGLSIHRNDGQSTPLNPEDVQDIIRLPKTNESVEITMRSGNVVSGVVSIAIDAVIVVIGDTVQQLQTADVRSIRYRGTVSVSKVKQGNQTVKQAAISLNDTEECFLCSGPYFRSVNDEALAVNGAEASFVPGVTDSGLIAKDVVIELPEEDLSEMKREIGIIIFAPTIKKQFGYLGKEFLTKTYRLFKQCDAPKGNVRFRVDQLTFPVEPYKYIYAVSYQSRHVGDQVYAENIELVQVFSVAEYARIRIDENGNVQKLPASVLFMKDFVNQTAYIETQDGRQISGTLVIADEDEIILGDESGTMRLRPEEVLRISYRGTVTEYDPNFGTGCINAKHRFNVDSLIEEEQIFRLDVGAAVRFTKSNPNFVTGIEVVERTAEGDAAEIVPAETETPEEFRTEDSPEITTELGIVVVAPVNDRIIGYIGKDYITKTYSLLMNTGMAKGDVKFRSDALHFSINSHKKIYVVSYQCVYAEDVPVVKNIELVETYSIADYARVWIDESGKVQKLSVSVLYLKEFLDKEVDIETNDGRMVSGILSGVDDTEITLLGGSGTIRILLADVARAFFHGQVTAYHPNKGTGYINGQHWFHVNNFIDRNQILRMCVGASVRFTIEGSDKGNYSAVTSIEITENSEKRGYVLKYIARPGEHPYGFITDPEMLKECLKNNDKTGRLHFRAEHIENPAAFRIDTKKNYYRVSYTEGQNNRAYNVRFLEEYPCKADTSVKTRREVRNLSEFSAPADTDTAYEFGLISIYSSNYALINSQYFNRNHVPDASYDMSKSVYFNPKEATVIPGSRLKTTKYTYLIRYVKKGTIVNPNTGQEMLTIDYSYPVEVVHCFSKKDCTSILLGEDTITINSLAALETDPLDVPVPLEDYDEAPEILVGESIYFKLKGGGVRYGTYCGENDEAYLLSNEITQEKNTIAKMFRFGVITALNPETGTAAINNIFDFSLRVAEPQVVSILKNQKSLVRLHVMYSCENGIITEVCRVSKRCLTCLTWEEGVVKEYDHENRSITIDSANASSTHYLTVLSEGVNSYVNNRSILEREVFVKQVSHPYLRHDNPDQEIVSSAVDVRCQVEELRIAYDDGKDAYFGYRKSTVSFPIFGASRALQDRVGETILVTFRVGMDASCLEGYVETEYDEPEENAELTDEHSLRNIGQETLSCFLLQRECPESERSANMKRWLCSRIKTRCSQICLDPNSCYGELAFYLTTALRYPLMRKVKGELYSLNLEHLYRLFSLDFEGQDHLIMHVQSGKHANRTMLQNMFRKHCQNIEELMAHLVLLNKGNLEIVYPMIRDNQPLADEIIAYAKKIDDRISDQDCMAVIREVQDRYLRDKQRFSERMIDLIDKENLCGNLKNLISNMKIRFLKMVCNEDRSRFDDLYASCAAVQDYINKPDFAQQEDALQKAYSYIGTLENKILTNPCRESVDFLLSSGQFDLTLNILTAVKDEIRTLLNRLYQNTSKPRIHCRVNESTIHPESRSFWLIIENGSQNEKLQSAENLRIELESFTSGFMPQVEVHLTQKHISCGERLDVEVTFELTEDDIDVLEFGWTAYYDYISEFQSSGRTRQLAFEQESANSIQLQLGTNLASDKDYDAENPYYKPATGSALEEKKMFFGREMEKRNILECICTGDGEKGFVPGSAVIIHGQKQSGKTSLVNQIKNHIKEDPALADKAILLEYHNILSEIGNTEQLDCFQRTFYASIMARMKSELKRNHPDVLRMLKENDIAIPNLLSNDYKDTWPVAFDNFFQEFYAADQGRHTILLFMDEFTILCTTILSEVRRFPEKTALNTIPNFIKTFSGYGFVQIIIGHENMMRALETMGVLNHTAEFAKTIEISALDDAASRALVTRPMQEIFGYDVYGSELGALAVDRLLELSGRYPRYLMRLCNEMFAYYTDKEKCPRTQLLIGDVNAMVQEYAGNLSLGDFDILLTEDGDEVVESEKRITYRYLRSAALLSLGFKANGTADSGEIEQKLIHDFGDDLAEIERARNILEARRVISITNGGRVRINTGLFTEYIRQKNGLR